MFNKVIIVGNLTADPELKTTTSGRYVTTFNIACNRKDATDFFTVAAWEKTAEFINKFFTKGKPILICGQLTTRKWEDRNGNKRETVEILANEVDFFGRKEDDARPATQAAPAYAPQYGTPGDFEDLAEDDELPF